MSSRSSTGIVSRFGALIMLFKQVGESATDGGKLVKYDKKHDKIRTPGIAVTVGLISAIELPGPHVMTVMGAAQTLRGARNLTFRTARALTTSSSAVIPALRMTFGSLVYAKAG